ncbi:DEAD/DEAH box helicase [Tropicibacter sp. S64]|uniref:DEAD/DEAH box helicase n=1 Tax=Tropicibacter sp. S64 TaxID=3415122 RepID=UPI003C79EEF5
MISTLTDALAERGFDQLTDVQIAVTEDNLKGSDLLVSAQTGSGKTVGFGLAIASTLLGEDARFGPPALPLALVVAPTRELAMQVQRELEWLYGKAGGRIAACIGGMDARTERRALERGAHIVVGTPGRLRDHITRGALDLSDIRAIVLDEADEMLDLGFREDLEFMLGEAPEERRTLMFSATVSPAIAKLAEQYQKDAVRVSTISGKEQHADISYQAVQVAQHDTEHAIINLLRFHDAQTAIVFANTRAAVARLTARFANRGFSVVSLSGELSQDERSHALQALRDGRARVCVATDVAARGIDLPNLGLVIHADLPTNTEALLHRSGRTGRAGRKGLSVLIVPDKAVKKTERLLKWAKIDAEWTFAPSAEEILAADEQRLLSDAVWNEEIPEQDAAFAATLLELHGAEKVAAACLRLFRANLSAPEELNKPGEKSSGPREEFGPAVWYALSVGRDSGAEARWLLPLLCRIGNLDKSHIGRIRVLGSETFVEIRESAAQGFQNQLGPNGLLENEVHATRQDGEPAVIAASARRGPKPAGPGKPHRKGPREDGDRPRARREQAQDGPASVEASEAPAPRDDREDRPRKPRDEAPRERKTFGDKEKPFHKRDDGERPRKPRGDEDGDNRRPFKRPARDDDAPRKSFGRKPEGKFGKGEGRPWDKGEKKPYRDGDKPRRDGDKPIPKDGDKPFRRAGDKPFDKDGKKPFRKDGDKPFRKDGAKPARDGDKPFRKEASKPGGKPKPAFAADPSKRVERPGAAKPKGKGKPLNRGGDSPLRRKPKA